MLGFDEPAEPPPAVELPPWPDPSQPQPESLAGQTVYLVDSHSLIFQVFHAIPEMTGPAGQPVAAVFGFTRDMLDLLDQRRPDYLFCAFDLPGPTFRHELYDQYKIDRGEMPEDLRPQIPAIRELLTAMRIPSLDCATFEADDVLATAARQVEQRGGACYVVTGDKDCRQLITDQVAIYNIRKRSVFDADALQKDWGIRPDQVVDFQALVGDPTDNVPGVPLIGPKIARELLEKYETLEGVLDHAEEISGKKRKQNLIDGRDTALLSRQLVRLVDDVPIEIDWNAGRVGDIDRQGVLALCRQFGFRSLAERFGGIESTDAPKAWKADYRTIATPEELDELVAQLARQRRIAVDTETTHTNPRRAEIVGYSFAWKEGSGVYVPVRAPEGERCLDPAATLEALRGVLENPQIEKIGQNLKYDMVVLRSAGLEMAGAAFDTMVADYLLEAGGRNHGLDDLARRYLHHTKVKISELIGSGKNQRRMDEVPVEQVTAYAAEDADVPLRLRPLLERRLEESDLKELFTTLEMPLIDVLVEMEYNGIRVDTDRLAELSGQYGRRMDALTEEIYKLAGRELNIASPKQLAEVLFDELKLPVVKKTKTGLSTDAGVLAELARLHPLPAKIVEYRQYAKLKGTYVDALPELVHRQTGRVHTSLNQVVAATGRLSSNEPNLQNIPVRTEEGREIRSAFLPGHDDWLLLAADYSQIELRVLAHFSHDETLLAAFANDEDIHAAVAAQIYQTPLAEVTREMRRKAKAVNFGVIYGQSAFGLAKALDIEQEEAAEFIDAYFAQYPGVETLIERILVDCRADGYVATIAGRCRAIQGVREEEQRQRAGHQKTLPERTAVNTVIQGSAADLIKRAMIDVHRRLQREKPDAKMLLQIHDELIFEVPPEEVETLTQLVVEEMSAAGQLKVPLKVDVKAGPNWAACEAV